MKLNVGKCEIIMRYLSAMLRAWGARIFLFELFQNITLKAYGVVVMKWMRALGEESVGFNNIMQCMDIEQNNNWEALISFLGGGKKQKTRRREKDGVRARLCINSHRPGIELTLHIGPQRICVWSVMHYCIAESWQYNFKKFKK